MSAATKLRLVKLAEKGPIDRILDWVWSDEPPKTAFEIAREAAPSIDAAAEQELMDRVADLSRTVAALTGLDLIGEAMQDMQEQEAAGVEPDDFEPPDVDSMYGGEEPSDLEAIASSNAQSAYMRGRQDEDEGSDDWWEYVAQISACEVCAPLDGTQAPQDDGIWTDRIPPLHPNCVCVLKPIPPQKQRATEDDVPDESRGRRGWGNPQKRFDPDLSTKPEVLLPFYHDKLRNLRENE